jgi:hypothetical protein
VQSTGENIDPTIRQYPYIKKKTLYAAVVASIGEIRNSYKILVRNLKGKRPFENLHRNGKITLRRLLWKLNWMPEWWLDSCGSETDSAAGCCDAMINLGNF